MKTIYKTDIDIYKIIVYDKEEVDAFELNIKQFKNTPYIFRLFGFEIKMPFKSKRTIYSGINKDKYLNDMSYFSIFIVMKCTLCYNSSMR